MSTTIQVTAEDMAERVAELLPSETDPAVLRDAAEWLAAEYNGQRDDRTWHDRTRDVAAHNAMKGQHDPRSFDPRAGGGVNDHPDAPDAWSARKHETTAKRSNSGRTVTTVRKYGLATVQGDESTEHATTEHASVWPLGVVTALDDRSTWCQVRRARRDRVALDVLAVTDAAYSVHGLVPLLGTDVMAFSEMVDGDRSSRCSVAFSNVGLSGMARNATVDRNVAQTDAYKAHTDRLVWRPAMHNRIRARKAEIAQAGPGELPAAGVTLPAVDGYRIGRDGTCQPTTCQPIETMFLGHRRIARTEPVQINRKRTKLARRTIGTVTAPTVLDGWRILLDSLNRGERIVATSEDGTINVTRSPSGKYSATDNRPDGMTIKSARTVESVALKLTR